MPNTKCLLPRCDLFHHFACLERVNPINLKIDDLGLFQAANLYRSLNNLCTSLAGIANNVLAAGGANLSYQSSIGKVVMSKIQVNNSKAWKFDVTGANGSRVFTIPSLPRQLAGLKDVVVQVSCLSCSLLILLTWVHTHPGDVASVSIAATATRIASAQAW